MSNDDPKYVIVNGFDLTDKLIKEDNLYKIDLLEYKNEISIHIE